MNYSCQPFKNPELSLTLESSVDSDFSSSTSFSNGLVDSSSNGLLGDTGVTIGGAEAWDLMMEKS